MPSQSTNSPAWRESIAPYQRACAKRALWQLANTLIPYALLWYGMYRVMAVSLWLTLPLAVLAAAFLVRTFIIFHDCGHGSYFKSRRANDLVGALTGVLTFSPYHQWRWEHGIHHRSAGNLGRRGTGDVWTLTVQEYLEASRGRRFAYQLARNPLILFVIAPLFVFLAKQRFVPAGADAAQRRSVWRMNIALLGMTTLLSALFGIRNYVFIQLVVLALAGSAGLWLFYVQHQFEGVYWERGEQWDYTEAALRGSSFYKLPKILQWFSGNIGFHHVHHLSPRIPNYNLQRCHEDDARFREIKPVTLCSSLKALAFRLWDEQGRRLVGFAHVRQLRAQQCDGARRPLGTST